MADAVMKRNHREHVLSIPISLLLSCSALVSRWGLAPALRRQMMAINRKGTITASTQRACVGSLAAHLDKFAEFLVGEGYVSETIKSQICAGSGSQPLAQAAWSAAGKTRRDEAQAVSRPPSWLKETRRCIYRPSAVRAFAPPRSSCVTTKSRSDRSGAAHTRLREIIKFGARLGARDIDQLFTHRAKILNRAFRE